MNDIRLKEEKGWKEVFRLHCYSYYDMAYDNSFPFPKEEYMKKVADIISYLYFIGEMNDIRILSPLSSHFVYYKVVNAQTLESVHAEVVPVKFEEFKNRFKEPTDDEKAFLLLKSFPLTGGVMNTKAIFLHKYDLKNDLLYCFETDEALCAEVEYD